MLLREKIGIRVCIFKIGVTANPIARYKLYVDQGYATMWLIHKSNSLDLVHMLEAALILEYHKHVGCRNQAGTGGEGALNRRVPIAPPFFVYVVGARADQPRRVGWTNLKKMHVEKCSACGCFAHHFWIGFVVAHAPTPSCPTSHVVLVWPLYFQLVHFLAEAPCKHIVELAKAEAAANPYCSEEMMQFARIRLCDAERGVHSVLKQVGLICPVPVTELNLGPGKLAKFPCVKLSDWMLHLLNTNRIARQMVGVADFGLMQSVLTQFWERYRAINPDLAVFQMARNGALCLDRCIPFFSHTDEGRSYKHLPLWILSAHGALGRGTRSWLNSGKHRAPIRRNGMGMNFVGKTWSTQFMFASMLRTLSTQNPQAMTKLLEAFAADVFELMTHGVSSDDGAKIWMIHLATKGDLPALVKLGGFSRSFSHVPRAPRSRRYCQGICHLCLAGREADGGNIPFEDFSPSADWINTMFREVPWETEPTILQNLQYNQRDQIDFFRTDFWHNLHLGVSKHFVGSSFVSIIECGLPSIVAGSVEVKFQWLTGNYLAYWRSKGKVPFVTEISRETMGFPQGSTCPIARWSKAVASTEFMLYLEWFADHHIVGNTSDEILLSIVSSLLITSNYVFLVFAASKKKCGLFLADKLFYVSVHDAEARGVKAINIAVGAMYNSGFWLKKQHALGIGKLIYSFLAHFSICAHKTLQQGKRRFAITPKMHMLAHAGNDLLQEAQLSEWRRNPIAYSNQLQEDFIGRPSRVSRRVNIRSLHRSVLMRSLIFYQRALLSSDDDTRGLDGYGNRWNCGLGPCIYLIYHHPPTIVRNSYHSTSVFFRPCPWSLAHWGQSGCPHGRLWNLRSGAFKQMGNGGSWAEVTIPKG